MMQQLRSMILKHGSQVMMLSENSFLLPTVQISSQGVWKSDTMNRERRERKRKMATRRKPMSTC